MYLTQIRKLLHWGPILALSLIKIVTTMTIYCTNLWWPFGESIASTTNMLILLSLAFFTVYTFLNAVFIGPGYVPLAWLPEQSSDEKYMQFCVTCAGFKVPRSHHCHKCRRCVLKMDHHCPWINNCVGHFNHLYFVLFLISAIFGCFHSLWLLFITVIKFLNRGWYYYHGIRPPVIMSLFPVLMCLLSIGIAFGVMVSLSFLLYIQLKAILKNQTGIEEWIVDKANERRNNDPTLKPFQFPYDLGRYNNFRQVFNWGLVGNGITWNVAEGCTQYDLTIEQKEQKALKKMRILSYQVIRHYSGSNFPFVHGFGTLCHPPCTLEARIPLRPHDVVFVSRIHDYWMFGEKLTTDMKSKCKGWFPKVCVVPVSENAINKLKMKNL